LQPEWLKGILNTINNNKENVPKGRTLIQNTDSMGTEQLLSVINQLFNLEEDAIKEENSKKFVTDAYENKVRYFATQLVISMVPFHEKLQEFEGYRKLIGQRHIAYGFYNVLELGNEYCNNIIKDSTFERLLYLGLIAFYNNFYGSFSDNEQAIVLLCKYYPKNDGLDSNIDNIVSSIFRHITNAGTPSDNGFAFKGISLISKYIGNLPMEIIKKLLQKYELYRVVNDKVYRHQIFSIINNSPMTNEEKQIYKFSYLDSLLLANYMNDKLYRKYGEQQDFVTRCYLQFEMNLSNERIDLIKHSKTDNIYAYWTNDCSAERRFIVDEEVIIIVSLNINQKKIDIKYKNRPNIRTELFKFTYEDWVLDDYHSKETEQKLQDFVFENNSGETEIVYNNLTFSLLFLENYRGMSEQLVDFDHRFIYDKAENELSLSVIPSVIPHFYGRNIHSLSCIVGKNGTGKTSTVDFLRGTFFRLLHLISEYGVACVNGYIREEDYEAYGILDKGCKFFVVFYIGSQKPYFLTNIKAVTVNIAEPFNLSAFKSVNELSKVVYFSNKLSVSQDNLYTEEEMKSRRKNKEDIAKSLSGFRQADYSEVASFVQKRKGIESVKQKGTTVVNKDICYQLVFLEYLTPEKLEYYFDMPDNKVFTLKSALLGIEPEYLTSSYPLKDMLVEKSRNLKQILTAPDAKLDYFSSGQYAKFSFLAKFYWFLEGYKKNIQEFEALLGRNIFSRDEALLKEETALIFIDEGELYYHPEWQRSYIKDLVEIIHDTNTESKLQVVITTNSPFIISDILSEDITYLSEEEKDLDQTFGQNIHKLLIDNFFMSYTIGEYSREMIENIMKWLNNDRNKEKIGEELSRYFGELIEVEDYYEKIRCLIEKIGEPIYREKLLDMLSRSKLGIESEVEALLRQKAEIERKLKELQ
jgi:hypothetical protein